LKRPNKNKAINQGKGPQAQIKKASSFSFDLISYIETHPLIIFWILTVIIGFFVFKDYLIFDKLYIFKDIGSDTYNQAYPLYVHMANYLRTDGIPRWSFNIGMGQNIFPGGINDPFSLILYTLGSSKIAYAIVYVELLKIIAGGTFFLLYFRTMKFSGYTCLIGGLLYAFSGYMIIGTEWYNFSTFMVYVALTLWGAEKFIMEGKWYIYPIGIAFLSSTVFMFYTFGLFFILYVIIRYIEEKNWNTGKFLLFVLKLSGMTILGMLINSIIIVSGILQMLESPRVSGEAGYYNVLKSTPLFSLGDKLHNLTAIFRLFSNDTLGTGSNFKGWYNYLEAPAFYCGLISLILIPQLFHSLKKKQLIIYSLFLVCWLLIVLFPHFRHLYNLFAGDYYKVSISFIVTLVLIFFAVKSLNQVMILGKINRITLFITTLILILILFLLPGDNYSNIINNDLRMVITFILIIYTGLFYLISINKSNKFFKILLLVVVLCELGYFSFISTNKRQVEKARELKTYTGFNDYTNDAIKYLKKNDPGFYRINKNYFSGTSQHTTLNDAQIQNYYGTTSYMSFNNVYYINFLSECGIIKPDQETETRWATGLISRPLLQTMASVKYNLAKQGGIQYNLAGLNYTQDATFGDVTIFQNRNFLPFGFTYQKIITLSSYRKLDQLQKDIAILRAAIVEDNQVNLFKDFDILIDTNKIYNTIIYTEDVASLKKNTLELTKFSQNHMEGKIYLEQKKILFFSIPFDKGWHLKVDGKNQNLLMVNIGFLGALIEPGNHRIELDYVPPYLKISLILCFSGIIIYLGILFLPLLFKTKS
jgi:uncharacterized membrane protein YfhO